MNYSDLKLNFSLDNIDAMSSISNEEKNELILKLLTEMSCDKNSSSFREGVTLSVLGKNQSTTKLGYDSDDEAIEVKPKNLSLDSKKKFDGSGNFSDFTWARHKKYLDDKVKMLVSGFIDGKLIYIFSFDYNSDCFVNEIERQLLRHLPNGDEINKYVRSVKFSYLHFKDSNSFNIEFLKPNFSEFEYKFTKPFFEMIVSNEPNK
jgi:hypothetical protein